MKLLLLPVVFVLQANVAYAVDCSVNDLIKTPVKIPLPGKFEMCMINPQNKRVPKCVGQDELNYAREDIDLLAKTSCGFKGSKLQMGEDSLAGTLVSCENNRGTSEREYVSMCMNAKSADGQYMLKVCTDLQTVTTIATPLNPKLEKRGLLMVNEMGSSHVTHVNEVSCGDSRKVDL